jgi:hypothetical protein
MSEFLGGTVQMFFNFSYFIFSDDYNKTMFLGENKMESIEKGGCIIKGIDDRDIYVLEKSGAAMMPMRGRHLKQLQLRLEELDDMYFHVSTRRCNADGKYCRHGHYVRTWVLTREGESMFREFMEKAA